jgi:hypothetical protein
MGVGSDGVKGDHPREHGRMAQLISVPRGPVMSDDSTPCVPR